MSESLGKFVIDLEARIATLESDLGRAAKIADRRAKEMQATFDYAAKGILRGFGMVAGAVGAGLGVHAFADMIKGAIDAQDQAGKLAQKIGIATESVAGFTLAAQQADVSQQSFERGMTRLARNASDAATGLKTSKLAFDAIGVSVTDAQGKLKSTETLVTELADKFQGYADSAQKTAIATRLFGESGAALIPLLNGGSEAIAEATKLAEDFGLTIGSKVSAQANRFNDAMGLLGVVAKGAANQIAAELAPAMAEFAERAVQFFRSQDWKDWLQRFVEGTSAILDNIGKIVGAIKLLGEIVATVYAAKILRSGALFVVSLAEQLGGVQKLIVAQKDWGKTTADSFRAAQKNIGALGIAFNVAASAIVGWKIGTYLREEFRIVADAGDYLVYGIAQGWEEIKRAAAVQWESVKLIAIGSFDLILEGFATMMRGIAKAADVQVMGKNLFGNTSEQINAVADSISNIMTPVDNYQKAIAGINAEYQKNSAANKAMLADMQAATAADFAAKDGKDQASAAINANTAAALANAPTIRDVAAANDAATKAAKEYAAAQSDLVAALSEQRAATGPMAAALEAYKTRVIDATAKYHEFIAAGIDAGQAQQFLANELAGARQELARNSAEIKRQSDVLGNYMEQLEADRSLLGLSERQRQIEEAVRAVTKAYEGLTEEQKKLQPSLTEIVAKVRDSEGAFYDQSEAIAAAQRQAEKYASIVRGAFDSMVDAVADWAVSGFKNARDFWRGMVDLVKRAVAQMLAEWAKTKIIGWLTGGGGGGFGALVSGAAALLGASGSAGAGTVDFSSGTNSLFGGPTGWIATGKKLWDGFQTGFSGWFASGATSGSTIFGSYMGANAGVMYAPSAAGSQLGLVPNYAGGAPGMGVGVAPGSYGYTPSTLGYVAAGAAGAYAGWQRWQASGQDFGGAAGAAAYGVGTYSATIAAGAALSGGMAAGLAAIPVVGWIALAAMAVDMLSGGKLFGTKGKFHHSNLVMDVGAEGVDLAQSYTLKGEKAFFGGTRWTTESIDPSPEARAAAQEFYDALKEGRDKFAEAFNVEAGALIGGTFAAQFDKNGEITESSSTVLGVTYEGETQDQFAQRLTAENMIAVLSQFESSLSDMAQKYRATAESLMQFANASAMAQSALMDGMHMLALGSNQTLGAVIELAEGMQYSGETIEQTMQRLLQAQQQYDQFVGQFKPAATYVDDFEAGMSAIYHQMLANIDAANAYARAAGAERASAQDLANIHEHAARQMAALVAQLEVSAQALAYAMGLTEAGTLDQINAEIAELEGKANTTANAIGGFGNAMQDAARRASDAVNLLLGDLSPLNDQQKLQRALQGLREGTVTQEQVLQIGRRLYASSQAYTDLFNRVQAMGSRVAGANGYTVPGGSGNDGLTAEERARLSHLYAQREEARRNQDYVNAQTLAQQIAEIAMAKGVDFSVVMEDLGISQSELAERLHLDNAEQLDAYIQNIQEQIDSNGENTASIVDAIDRLGNRLDRLLGGLLHGERTPPAVRQPGRSPITREDAELIGEAVGRHVGRQIPPPPRGNRQPVYAP